MKADAALYPNEDYLHKKTGLIYLVKIIIRNLELDV